MILYFLLHIMLPTVYVWCILAGIHRSTRPCHCSTRNIDDIWCDVWMGLLLLTVVDSRLFYAELRSCRIYAVQRKHLLRKGTCVLAGLFAAVHNSLLCGMHYRLEILADCVCSVQHIHGYTSIVAWNRPYASGFGITAFCYGVFSIEMMRASYFVHIHLWLTIWPLTIHHSGAGTCLYTVHAWAVNTA